MIQVKFVKTHPDAKLPKFNNLDPLTGDAGADLYSVELGCIPARGSAIVDVGLKVGYIPPGWYFTIETRSGLGFKHSLMVHRGIIDTCVPAGTKISTSEGDIEVSELFSLEDKPLIYSFNVENHAIEHDRIKDMWVVPSQELMQIETTDGTTLQIPKAKSVYTKRGWIEARNLTIHDEILSID